MVAVVLASFALARWWPEQQGEISRHEVQDALSAHPAGAAHPQWMWVHGTDTDRGNDAQEHSVTFFLVREFDIAPLASETQQTPGSRQASEAQEAPGTGAPDAPDPASTSVRLFLASDADILVHLNGLWLAAHAGAAGQEDRRARAGAGPLRIFTAPRAWRAPLAQQHLDLTPFVRSGRNRVLLAVRSATGSGAVLADLQRGALGAAATQHRTIDTGWLVASRDLPGLQEGWLDLRGAADAGALEAPRIWGEPPLGRYEVQSPDEVELHLVPAPLDLEQVPAHTITVQPDGFAPRSVQQGDEAAARPSGGTPRSGEGAESGQRPPPPRGVRLEWSPSAYGHLHLRFSEPPHRVEIREAARLPQSPGPGAPSGMQPLPEGAAHEEPAWRRLVLDGQALWHGAAARRYGRLEVRFWGADLAEAAVHPLPPAPVDPAP